MLLSKLFIPITKDLPAEAKIKSHQLMLRTGMIRQASAGIYSWLPLGFKVMKKIEKIVREEQNIIGAQEMLMPTVQSADIWRESGRYDDYGEEMLRISDRQKREMLYGPTNEEQITEIFRTSIKSYKLLPQILYHIQWKFRDELRPRFGVMRCREFYMKDAYSFDLSDDDAALSYNKMFFAYLKTFERLGLKSIPMKADTGPIGGDLSHEFIILAETGESKIYTDKNIFEVNHQNCEMNKISLENLRKNFDKYYAVTDEKYNKIEFDKLVKKEDQLETKGIEVGHIFYFGDKYSKPMNASVDHDGKKVFVKMGSYGVGVSRLVGAIIEAKFDEKNENMIWPINVAPYECVIIPLISKSDKTNLEKSMKVFNKLKENKIDTIIDNTEENFSSKMKKFNLIGVPYQILLGKKSDNEMLEFRKVGEESTKLKIDDIIKIINSKKEN